MSPKSSNGVVYGAVAFFVTLGLIFFVFRSSGGSKEHEVTFKNPQKIETSEGVAYSLDTVDGDPKDLTFRCDPKTGEGYFSLKSKSLSWASSHCQDMVGAVTDIIEGKKSHAIVQITIAENQVLYRVERNR